MPIHQRFMAGHFIQDDVGEELANAVIRFVAEGEDNLARASRVGYEILQVISPSEIIVWITGALTPEEFEAIEVPTDWLKNQPRESQPDAGSFARSPTAQADGEFVDQVHFGHQWRHVATVTGTNIPLDDDGLLRGTTVAKFHEIIFNAGRTIFVLVSPEGDEYIRVSRDAGRTMEEPNIPSGWQLLRFRTTAPLILRLPDETLVIRTDNEDSFQGPIVIPDTLTETISDN